MGRNADIGSIVSQRDIFVGRGNMGAMGAWRPRKEGGEGGGDLAITTPAAPQQHRHHRSTTHIDHQAATLPVTVKVTSPPPSPTPSCQTSCASNEFPLYPVAHPIYPLPSPDIYHVLPEKNHRRPVKSNTIPPCIHPDPGMPLHPPSQAPVVPIAGQDTVLATISQTILPSTELPLP